MSLSIVSVINSYTLSTKTFSSTINNTLIPNYVKFPGPDDFWYSKDDKIYPLIDLIRLPEAERYNYYDPHPDRGDSGVIKIDETNKNDNLTSFLILENFQSHDGKPYLRVHPSLIYALQHIKDYTRAGKVEIISGYRTKSWNALKGGKPNSFHMDGLAADVRITIPNKTSGEANLLLKEAAELVVGNYGGVGYYPSDGFVHVDTRGTRARWRK